MFVYGFYGEFLLEINIQKVLIDNFEVCCYHSLNDAVDDIFQNRLNNSETAIAINPEKILSARKNISIKESINNATLLYIDGVGVLKVAESKLRSKLSRLPGCELWEALMIKAAAENKSVYLLGATEEVVEDTKSTLEKQYKTNIIGYHSGYFDSDDAVIKDILKCKPDILTVAMGSPRQELFMEKCKYNGVKAFMMGVGGTYNVYTGRVKRAPEVWRELGLEWLYRLLSEPLRINRQIKLVVFIFLFLRKKI